jgi:hypothetical protein
MSQPPFENCDEVGMNPSVVTREQASKISKALFQTTGYLA